MYDGFSADYDRFVDWDERLAAEMPFIERQLRTVDARQVLDTACGTGRHAIALARGGYDVVGVDASEGMIERARTNAADARRPEVQFEVAGFGELAQALGLARSERRKGPGDDSRFDALLCLGNSLPHVVTPPGLAMTLNDFADCLRPGALLLIQNRNFDAVLAEHERWMGPQGYQEKGTDWLFLRFYDFDPDGLLTFNIVRLRREQGRHWRQEITSTRLWPLTKDELGLALQRAGFGEITYYGDMGGLPFEVESSPNLVVAARNAS